MRKVGFETLEERLLLLRCGEEVETPGASLDGHQVRQKVVDGVRCGERGQEIGVLSIEEIQNREDALCVGIAHEPEVLPGGGLGVPRESDVRERSPEPVERGQQIAFALREPQSARDDMKAMLAGLGVTQSAFGLYLNCCARGASFFGVPGLEAAYLENHFGSVPIAGMFGSCEIGPIGGRTELLTYTGVLALIDG